MALATIEEITQDALVLTGDSIDSSESGTTLVGYVVRESLDPSVWLPWGSQNTILEGAYPALAGGKAYPGDMTASTGISFIMTTEGSGNRDLAELTYDYLYVDQSQAQNIPTAWTNQGLLRARITFDLGFQGTVSVSMPGLFRGNWFNGFTAEDDNVAGKVGRFTASFYMEDFLDADWPANVLDVATATKADIRQFINDYKSDITNFTIDWIADASFMTSPASQLTVNVDSQFIGEVCLPSIDTAGGTITNLVLDDDNCITVSASAAGGDVAIQEGGTQRLAAATAINFNGDDFNVVGSGSTATISLANSNDVAILTHTQNPASSQWEITNTLNSVRPVITVYDTSGEVILPMSITAATGSSGNTVTIEFPIAVAGFATLVG